MSVERFAIDESRVTGMITGSVADIARYKGLSPEMDTALDFIVNEAAAAEVGRTDISDTVFANVMEYAPVAAEAKQFEAHVAYIDVQYVVAGAEQLHSASIDAQAYDYGEGDCVLMDAAGAVGIVPMPAGTFCILWPGEAHKPGIASEDTTGPVKKVVVKVPAR